MSTLSLGATTLQVALLFTLLEAARRRDVSAAVNALVALAVALLPALLGAVLRDPAGQVAFGSALPLWLAAAGLVHAVGMLGLYESVWWWDHLAHTLSAALVAALCYAGFLVTGVGGGATAAVAGATVLAVFVVGLWWELLELLAREVGRQYGVEPLLVTYGVRDTALDLVFDVVGAALVVALNVRLFVPVAGRYPEGTRLALLAAAAVVVFTALPMVLFVGPGRDAVR